MIAGDHEATKFWILSNEADVQADACNLHQHSGRPLLFCPSIAREGFFYSFIPYIRTRNRVCLCHRQTGAWMQSEGGRWGWGGIAEVTVLKSLSM